jgi:Ca2+-binding RTX toxin-like protein
VRQTLGGFLVLVCALALASAGAGAPTFTPDTTFRGYAVGGMDSIRQEGSGSNVLHSDSSYRVRFDFTFTIKANGEIAGSGTGVYTLLTWHLYGKNDKGSFDCKIPVVGKPFTATVYNPPQPGPVFRITVGGGGGDAQETNEDYDCGAGKKGLATTTDDIVQSLLRVLTRVPFDPDHPVIPVLTHDEEQGAFGQDGYHHIHDEWALFIAPPGGTLPPPPATKPPPGKGKPSTGTAGLAGGTSPAGPSGPATFGCTVKGTAGNDALVGTAGRDVICGFAGNDTIKALAGDDIVYGGGGKDTIDGGAGSDSLHGNAGNDRFRARDRQPDYVNGEGGTDTAIADKGRDTVRGVEKNG